MGMYNGLIVLSVLYGSETLKMNAGLRDVDVFEMSSLRPIRGVTV